MKSTMTQTGALLYCVGIVIFVKAFSIVRTTYVRTDYGEMLYQQACNFKAMSNNYECKFLGKEILQEDIDNFFKE